MPRPPVGLHTDLSKGGNVSAFFLCPYDSTLEWSVCLCSNCHNPSRDGPCPTCLVWSHHRYMSKLCPVFNLHLVPLLLSSLCLLTFFYLWHLPAHLAPVINHLWASIGALSHLKTWRQASCNFSQRTPPSSRWCIHPPPPPPPDLCDYISRSRSRPSWISVKRVPIPPPAPHPTHSTDRGEWVLWTVLQFNTCDWRKRSVQDGKTRRLTCYYSKNKRW